MADLQVDGFLDVFGTKSVGVFDHFGPSSYTTGGEIFPDGTVDSGLNGLGLSRIYWLSSGITDDGLYFVTPVFPTDSSAPTTVKLVWYDIAASTGGTFTGTPAVLTGTNSAPTITTGTNATVTAVVATNGGALTQATGQTGVTGVQAPVLTMDSYTPAGTIAGGSGAGFVQVDADTDLSASHIRLFLIGG